MAKIQILIDGEHRLRRAHWVDIATSDPALANPPPRMGRNPANGEPIQLRLPPDERSITLDGEIVGHFGWSSFSYPGPEWDDDLGIVLVSHEPGHESYVNKTASKFAEKMSAELVLD